MRIAKESDWETQPLPELNSVVMLGHHYSEDDMDVIKKGVIPEEMEDKWFIYWKESQLYFYRSWTGYCIYILDFEKGSTSYIANRFLVNRDSQQYKETDDEVDKATILKLIQGLMLS